MIGLSGKFQFIPEVQFHWSEQRSEVGYVPSYGNIPEKELVMVFIASSTCPFSNHSQLPELIEDTKLNLQRKALDLGLSFSTIGVSIDWVTSDGITHLNKFGNFDEVMTGRKWHGTGANIYLEQIPGINATPQILVLARIPEQSGDNGVTSAKKEMPIYRIAGLLRISNWLEQGLPLPQDALDIFSHIPNEMGQ